MAREELQPPSVGELVGRIECQKRVNYSEGERVLAEDTARSGGFTLQNRTRQHREKLVVFQERLDVPPGHNGSERDLRNPVITRKIPGRFRSNRGPRALAAIATVVETAKRRGQGGFKTLLACMDRSLPADSPTPMARSQGET